MSARYIAWQGRTPRPDLPGSPFASKLQAMKAARKARIGEPKITTVTRRTA